jgi:RNA methyltransferase, TrmH family
MLTSRETKELRALHRRRERLASGRFLAEGIRVVEDLLSSSLQVRWVLTASSLEDSLRGLDLIAAIDRAGLIRRTVTDREFAALADTENSQGVIAVAEIPVSDFGHLDLVREPAVVLVLDAVQDPGNFGTLVRTAEALGAAGVIVLPGTVDPWNPKSVRSAAGSAFRMPILSFKWEEASAALRQSGMSIVAAALEGDPLGPVPIRRAALVVGNEGSGLSPHVREDADRLVRIPLRGRAESLNVSAAAAILLYELTRDHQHSVGHG